MDHSKVKCWYWLDTSYCKNSIALYVTNTENTSDWVLDYGATSHMTNDGAPLLNPQMYTGTKQVLVGNGELLPIENSGQGLISTPN